MAKTSKKEGREAALEAIQKKFGRKPVSAAEFDEPVSDVIPTGSLGLDINLGVGGYPRGRIIEIYGPNASGKTTLTLHAIANAQRQGIRCAFVDAEHALDLHYVSAIGVDLEQLDYMRPESGEEALEVVEILSKSDEYGLIVVDSVAALVPQREVEGDMGASHVGLQARLISQAMRKLVGVVAKNGTTLILLNQLRQKVGVMYGSPDVTSGGQALGFYASVRLDVRRVGTLKVGDDVIGGRTRVKIVKNKMAGTAFHKHEFDMYSNNEYGAGISYEGEVFERAVQLGLIDKAGAWYSYEGERLGQGKDNALLALKKHPVVLKNLTKQIILQQSLRQEVKQVMINHLESLDGPEA